MSTDAVSNQIRVRIRLSVAAYAYEMKDDPIITDAEFDELAKQVDLQVLTGNNLLDKFFLKHFNPSTGVWVRSHPELAKLDYLYKLLKERK